MTPFRLSRLTSVMTLASLFIVALSGLVLAQTTETTITTETRARSRQLDVLDLAGQPLQSMSLQSGLASPFQVRVTDRDIVPTALDADFRVQATMNHLYKVVGESAGQPVVDQGVKIASDKIAVSYATDPLGASDIVGDLLSRYLLSTDGAVTCTKVAGLLALDATQQLTDPICGLLDTLGLSGTGLTFADVPLTGDLVTGIDLGGLGLSELPLAISGGTDTGVFTQANCASGLGAGDPSCTGQAGTPKVFLRGDRSDSLALDSLLQSAVDAVVDIVGATGVATESEVIAALYAAGGNVREFGQTLEQYTVTDQVTLINGLLAGVVADLGVGDLAYLAGRYRGLPMLTVDAADAPEAGQYAGTLTVTLIEGA